MVVVIPIAIAMAFLILSVRWVGVGVLLAIFLEWIPAVNPVSQRAAVQERRQAST